jgi:catechol 2,3-dioxygenase-like lactoylglutathione lyase family enzyme
MRSLAAALALAAAAGSPSPSPVRPPIVGVSHIAFRVADLARARAFYGGLLGLDERERRFPVNARQFVEIVPGRPGGDDDRLDHVAFETVDVDALRTYLLDRGVAVGVPVVEGGDRVLHIADPDGHAVEFVQYASGTAASRDPAPAASGRAISSRILHVGLTVASAAAADRFYKDVLGFSEIWRGGRTDAATDWINMRVPEGTDYLEYMLVSGPVDRERLGTLHHVALLVPDIQAALEAVRARPGGWDATTVRTPSVGRNNRWQLNLYDPDGSRAELMEPFTMR